jgi:arylsulfatase A-like enzyme
MLSRRSSASPEAGYLPAMRASTLRRGCRLRVGICAALAWVLAAGSSCDGPVPRPSPELRIVLITFDTLRADGLDARRMPRTWAFSERGARFERFYAASSATQPTHATLFTGHHPWEHGVARNGIALDAGYETVAERLRSSGFATAAVVASFALDRRFALDQGFDSYEQEFEHMLVRGEWQGQPVEGRRFYGLAEPVVARALERLDAMPGARQFLWLHLFDPHEPYGDAAGGPLAVPSRIRQLASLRELERGHLRYARRLYDASSTPHSPRSTSGSGRTQSRSRRTCCSPRITARASAKTAASRTAIACRPSRCMSHS